MELGLDDQVYNRLLKERIIFLGSVVEDSMANAIAAQMLLLAAEDPNKDIYLYINSPGGSVTAGMAIYDTMQYIKNDVATVAMGLAASMGQFLLCAGAPGKRYALPHARIMMHQPSGGIGGTASDIKIQAEQMDKKYRATVQQQVQQAETEREAMRLQVRREDSQLRTETTAHDTVLKTETQKEIEVLKAQLALVLAHINKTDLKEANAEAVERAI